MCMWIVVRGSNGPDKCVSVWIVVWGSTGPDKCVSVWIVVWGSNGPHKCVYVHVDCGERKYWTTQMCICACDCNIGYLITSIGLFLFPCSGWVLPGVKGAPFPMLMWMVVLTARILCFMSSMGIIKTWCGMPLHMSGQYAQAWICCAHAYLQRS